jgi:hypothetical protein
MENEKLLELCDKKIKLTKELESKISDEGLEMIRELIQVEKELQKYVCRRENEIEVI